jgi:hypothetical protein
MKSKIFLATSFLTLALVCQPSVYAQSRLPTPKGPTPDSGKPKPTDTVTGGTQKIVNSKLLIYTRDGMGTANTNIGGEFPSQLSTSATVNNEFSLQWSRTKAGGAEKASVYIAPSNSTAWVRVQGVTMPAQSTLINIACSMPKVAANAYQLMVVGETGSSNRVMVNYTGKDSNGQPLAIPQGPGGGLSAPAKSPLYITAAKFTPEVGALNEPGHQRAKLTLTLKTPTTTTISKIEIEALSEPFTNPELITSSNSKNSPIVILKGKWEALGGSYQIHNDKENTITVILRRTSKNDVQGQESEPGFYSPSDWGYAFGQTTTASFRWSVTGHAGNLSGSFEQSPKKVWLWQ